VECAIPDFDVFERSPFNLVAGDMLQGKLRAKNMLGWSDYSEANDLGPIVKTSPVIDNGVVYSSSRSTYQKIELSWNAPENNGGSSITSYQLSYQ